MGSTTRSPVPTCDQCQRRSTYDDLRDRTIAVMQHSRTRMGADDIPIDALQRRVSARGQRIRVDRTVNSVRDGVSPTSPPGELSTLTRSPRGDPSSPLGDRIQSALASFSSALGQSDGQARQRSPAKYRPHGLMLAALKAARWRASDALKETGSALRADREFMAAAVSLHARHLDYASRADRESSPSKFFIPGPRPIPCTL